MNCASVCQTEVYGIPLYMVGLSASPTGTGGTSLKAESDTGGDAMRRRDLLSGTAIAAAGAAMLPLGAAVAADGVTDTVQDVLFGRLTAQPISARQLAAQLGAARADFRACRYTQLARRLPNLLAQAISGRDQAPEDHQALASGQLSQAYSVATQLLAKLHDDGLACATADRAVQASRVAADPLVAAEATRLAATVLRRARHRDGAQTLVLGAARQLEADTGLSDPAHVAMYAQLLAVAAYTAAMRDDRDTAHALLGEAEDATRRFDRAGSDRFTPLDLAVYKISLARVLGDYGSAVEYARLVDPARISSPERRARYWQDTALALHGRGRTSAAFQALLLAERDSSQEVRYRPWAQQLTHDLMTSDIRHALPGLGDFARRVGVAGG
jgi:hypothetical protein